MYVKYKYILYPPFSSLEAICKRYGSGFRSDHVKLFLPLDIANWCALPYYFNVIFIMNTLACSAQFYHLQHVVILLRNLTHKLTSALKRKVYYTHIYCTYMCINVCNCIINKYIK